MKAFYFFSSLMFQEGHTYHMVNKCFNPIKILPIQIDVNQVLLNMNLKKNIFKHELKLLPPCWSKTWSNWSQCSVFSLALGIQRRGSLPAAACLIMVSTLSSGCMTSGVPEASSSATCIYSTKLHCIKEKIYMWMGHAEKRWKFA